MGGFSVYEAPLGSQPCTLNCFDTAVANTDSDLLRLFIVSWKIKTPCIENVPGIYSSCVLTLSGLQ